MFMNLLENLLKFPKLWIVMKAIVLETAMEEEIMSYTGGVQPDVAKILDHIQAGFLMA